MCDKNIRGGSPIVIFTASLFQPSGRWSEHLTTDTTCSVDCLSELSDFKVEDVESSTSDEGADCDRCGETFDAGYTFGVGWAKPKSQKRGWHKMITTKQFCSHSCIATELLDDKSALKMDIPKKKPKAKRKAPTKKKPKKKKKK
jgi:hypothetical protein